LRYRKGLGQGPTHTFPSEKRSLILLQRGGNIGGSWGGLRLRVINPGKSAVVCLLWATLIRRKNGGDWAKDTQAFALSEKENKVSSQGPSWKIRHLSQRLTK